MTVSTSQQPSALELSNVVKRFGDNIAVDGLSFQVTAGTITALLGPNGAGKTTIIEMCEGFQKPDSGKISVLGINPADTPDLVRSQVGIMLQDGGSYSGVKVFEMLRLSASYSANPLSPEWLLELFGLDKVRNSTYRRLSGGQKQRLNLALAIITRPRLVFLDEPTAGMDAQSRILVWNLVRALRNDGVTVILTTHLMDEAQALADHVIIINNGNVVAEGSPAELRKSAEHVLHFETDSALDLSCPPWRELQLSCLRPQVYRAPDKPTPETIAAIAHAAATSGVLITKLETNIRSLEDVFFDFTGKDMQ